MTELELNKKWIQYLKKLGIVSKISDSETGKLKYIKPVYEDDLFHFLELNLTIETPVFEKILSDVLKKNLSNYKNQNNSFVDKQFQLIESDVIEVFKKIIESKVRQESEERLSSIKRLILESEFLMDSKLSIINNIIASKSGNALPTARIKKTFLNIINSQKRVGFFSNFPIQNKGMTLRTIVFSWRSAGMPTEKNQFLSFLDGLPFEENVKSSAYLQSENFTDNDDFPDGYIKTVQKYVKYFLDNFNDEELNEIIFYIKSLMLELSEETNKAGI